MTSLIGKKAPQFKATAVQENQFINDFSLDQYLGKNVLFFFYPLDFTFVCPTELHAFQEYLGEFEKRNCKVVACSVDSHFSHLAWLNTAKKKGGIEGITYPIVSDLNKKIAEDYGVLISESGIALRGLFLIDTKGLVRHCTINDLPIGRSVPEAIRTLDALLFFEKNGEVCPANWQVGHTALKPTQEGVEKYFFTSP